MGKSNKMADNLKAIFEDILKEKNTFDTEMFFFSIKQLWYRNYFPIKAENGNFCNLKSNPVH